MRKRVGICVLLEFVCVAVLALLANVTAQDSGNSGSTAPPSVQSSPPPVFRATSRLVLLDVIVSDHHGQFIPGGPSRIGRITIRGVDYGSHFAASTLPQTASLREALNHLLSSETDTLIVTDEQGNRVGTLDLNSIRRATRGEDV